MPGKHENDISLSKEQNSQIEHILEQVQHIAGNLHSSTNEEQVETALTQINNLSETEQIALLKSLAKEQDTDAADIAQAMNEQSPSKNVRKEARRSLLRLEAAKIYPIWTSPVTAPPMIQLAVDTPPRFWKGFVTQSREEGEVQLILTWEQGYDYSEARMLIFLLDFWEQGVKDFIIDNTTKRSVDAQIEQMRTRMSDITLVDCTLAEGRRLLEEALAVNAWRGTTPHKDYRHYSPTIKQLVLNNPRVGEDRGRTFINPNLQPDEVAATFVGGWVLGDYGLTYDLITANSGLRDGLTRAEWIEHHYAWATEAKPSRFDLGFVREAETATSGLWLPGSFGSSRLGSRKEIEIGWSAELADTQLSGTLKEMPMGTAVNRETGRHWFWTKYTLVQEAGAWRISQMSDEGVRLQGLPLTELQQQSKDLDAQIQDIMQKNDPNSPDSQQAIQEIAWRMDKNLYYDDALIAKLPLDRTYYEDAYSRAMSLNLVERALVYLDRLLQKFPDQQGQNLQNKAILQESLSASYYQLNMDERGKYFAEQAEATIRQSLEVENDITGHALLAEALIRQGEKYDEAEEHLQLAKTMAKNAEEEAMIEDDLGNLELRREHLPDALHHYQRVAEIDPNFPDIWFRIGFMQRNLQQYDEAERTYEHAIEVQPQDIRPYSELTAILMNKAQITKAREVLERGLRAVPRSPHLLALLSSTYSESGDLRRAEAVLQEAEQVNPNLEIVQAMREHLNAVQKK